ncbi:MAG: hypothetical protein FJY17_08690 [Bacteroidetes bacterium]|nr:hypothetical protein [Bacteroidota bacterium]
MLRQTEAYQLNPVTRCMSKDHMLKKWYCVAKTTEVTINSGLPGGNRNNNGTFNNIGKNGNWWSYTENNTNNAWNRNLNYNNGNVNRNNNNKEKGFSVRCLRDSMETSPRFTSGGFILHNAT